MQAINPADGIQVGGIFVHIYFSHTSDVELNFVECWRSRLKVSRREKERGESKKKKTQKKQNTRGLVRVVWPTCRYFY